MSAAGTSDATLISFIHARRARLEPGPSADDLIRLKQAGVSEKVIEYLAGISSAGSRNRESRGYVSTEAASDGSDVVAYDSPGGHYYRPYAYDWGWGFYGPYIYPGFAIRGRFGFHHFHGRRFR